MTSKGIPLAPDGNINKEQALGDTGGDHDLYDYCVDDPINLNDPSGLHPAAAVAAFLKGKALVAGIAATGAYGSAYVVDKIKSYREGKESTVTRDAMNTVAPKVGLSSGAGALPGATVMAAPMVASVASGAMNAANNFAGRIFLTSNHGEKITNAARFAEGFLNPNAPVNPSFAGGLGSVAGGVYNYAKGKLKE